MKQSVLRAKLARAACTFAGGAFVSYNRLTDTVSWFKPINGQHNFRTATTEPAINVIGETF